MHRSFFDRTRRQIRTLSRGPFRILLDIEVRRIRCRQCRAVKLERISFLADNPLYTQRFAYYVERCRSAAIKDIADESRLDWNVIKEVDNVERIQAGTSQSHEAELKGNRDTLFGPELLPDRGDFCRGKLKEFAFEYRRLRRQQPSNNG